MRPQATCGSRSPLALRRETCADPPWDLPQASSYLDGHAEVVSLLELFCSIGFHSPGTTLGGGGMGGMGKRMGGMSRDVRGGVGSLNASCTDLASLG